MTPSSTWDWNPVDAYRVSAGMQHLGAQSSLETFRNCCLIRAYNAEQSIAYCNCQAKVYGGPLKISEVRQISWDTIEEFPLPSWISLDAILFQGAHLSFGIGVDMYREANADSTQASSVAPDESLSTLHFPELERCRHQPDPEHAVPSNASVPILQV